MGAHALLEGGQAEVHCIV